GGVSALLSQDRKHALVNVRVRGDGMEVTEALEAFAARKLNAHPGAPARDDLADRVAWIAAGLGKKPDIARVHNAMKVLAAPGDLDEGWTIRRQAVLREFLSSDDALILADGERKQLEGVVTTNPPDLSPIVGAFSPESKIAVDNLRERLSDARQELGVERA